MSMKRSMARRANRMQGTMKKGRESTAKRWGMKSMGKRVKNTIRRCEADHAFLKFKSQPGFLS